MTKQIYLILLALVLVLVVAGMVLMALPIMAWRQLQTWGLQTQFCFRRGQRR